MFIKAKRVAIIFGVIYTFQVFLACVDCGGPGEDRYELNNITAHHIDNTGDQYTMTTANQVSKSAYGILVTFEISYLAKVSENSFSLITSSYACSPVQELHGMDTISNMEIRSLQDFDAEHLAGSDVSDLFEIVNMGEVKKLDDYVDRFGSGNTHDANSCYLMLKTPPTGTGPFEFELEALMKDGRKLKTTTSAIELVE